MIQKPFSRLLNISYRDFLNQNYFIALNNHSLKKINLKGLNTISKANDPDFVEIEEGQIIQRKFESFDLSPELIVNEEKELVAEIIKERLEKTDQYGNMDISFNNLGAAFSIEMIDIVWIFEMSSEEFRKGLAVIEDSLHFCEKADSYNKFIESSKKYLEYLENPSEHKLLSEVKQGFEDCVKDYDGNPFAHFMLGLIYHRPTVYFDLKKSVKEFSEAKRYSLEIENHYMTAMCNYMIAWFSYLESDVDKAIELSLVAIDNEFMNIPEIYFNLSKYYAINKDHENSLKYLDEAIRRFDILYAIKADIDDDFKLIRQELKKYFFKLKEEEKSKVKDRLKEMGINFTSEAK
jgi:hypothetical protein